MADIRHSRRGWLGEVARSATLSMLIGVAFLFLIFVGRQEFWGWRLFVYGAFGGLAVYVGCHSLDATVGRRIRRSRFLPDKAVRIVIYLLGGWAGFLAVTGVMQAFGLMPFDLSLRDLRLVLLINGGVSIVVGLLFSSFHVMRQRLKESIERIKEAEFAEKELELARSIQSRLLPPTEICGDGFRISARNLPAGFVAGDFYDVFHLGDGTLGLVVADVSGKGIGASLIMASVKAVVPLVAAERSAAETLRQLNRKLCAELSAREFVALAFARYDPGSGALEIANAGLPDPYRIRAGGCVEALSVTGPRLPLGARRDIAYESLHLTLGAGERVLFVSDGLPEAPTAQGDPLGYEVLVRLVSSAASAPGEFLDGLLGAVRASTSSPLQDDWTALLLERRR